MAMPMSSSLTSDEVLAVVLRSPCLAKLAGQDTADAVLDLTAANPAITIDDLVSELPDLQDLPDSIVDDEYLSLRLISDDEGGSECGPWESDVYGFAGIWVAFAADHEKEWFLEHDDAVDVAYDRAHDVIVEERSIPVQDFQRRHHEEPLRLRGSASPASMPATAELLAPPKQRTTSPDGRDEPAKHVAEAEQCLLAKVRVSGHTAMDEEPSDTTPFVATFPPRRRSVPKSPKTK